MTDDPSRVSRRRLTCAVQVRAVRDVEHGDGRRAGATRFLRSDGAQNAGGVLHEDPHT
jgi:hypothetical protein